MHEAHFCRGGSAYKVAIINVGSWLMPLSHSYTANMLSANVMGSESRRELYPQVLTGPELTRVGARKSGREDFSWVCCSSLRWVPVFRAPLSTSRYSSSHPKPQVLSLPIPLSFNIPHYLMFPAAAFCWFHSSPNLSLSFHLSTFYPGFFPKLPSSNLLSDPFITKCQFWFNSPLSCSFPHCLLKIFFPNS